MDKVLKQLRETVKKKKEQLFSDFENRFLNNQKNNKIKVFDGEKPIHERTFIPKLNEKVNDKSSVLEAAKKERENNIVYDSFSIKEKFKDANGNSLKTPLKKDVDYKYSDNEIVKFNVTIKKDRHITYDNARGKNLDDTHDGIADTLVRTREVFSECNNLQDFKQIVNDSLKISEARGIVVNKQHNMFQDYFIINSEKHEKLNISAVSLSSDILLKKEESPDANVICHSSLHKPSPNSFMNSIEINTAKMIASELNTSIFVTGDVSISDPELINFIGDRRLIITESGQINFDYYYYAVLSSGEQVVMRGDLKNRPLERVDNIGEILNSDNNTYMYVGQVENFSLKQKKVISYCDKNIDIINDKIDELKRLPGSKGDDHIDEEIRILEMQVSQLNTFRKSQSISDLDSFEGMKPMFYGFKEEKESDLNSAENNTPVEQEIKEITDIIES